MGYKNIIFLLMVVFSSLRANQTTEQQSVVIIGSGVGALTSATYLSRAGYSPIVIEGPVRGGKITQTNAMENWPGEIVISGENLVEKMFNQAKECGAIFYNEKVIKVDFSSYPFIIITKAVLPPYNERKIFANACIIGMGTTANVLNIPGENKYWGKGVSICATCDGALFRNKDVAVIGGGDVAVIEAMYLSNLANKVYVVLRKDEFKAKDKKRLAELLKRNNVEVRYDSIVKNIDGDEDSIDSIFIENKKTFAFEKIFVEGVFLCIGSTPNTALFKNQVCLDEHGLILLKNEQETSIQGVYAVGDITDKVFKQAVTAAGDGAKAAIQAQDFLEEKQICLKANNLIDQVEKVPLNKVVEILSKEQFDEEMKDSNLPIIVDFYASWCSPCKRISPYFDHQASIFSGKVKILKVNVDKLHQLSQRYNITSMPTMMLFDETNQVCSKKIGTHEILQFLTKLEGIKEASTNEINTFFQKEKKGGK